MTYGLRHRILRPHQTIEDCKYDHDDDPNTIHAGAFYEGKLVSVASFLMENHPDFSEDVQYRLRGMATVEELRNQGLGRAVVSFGVTAVKERGANFIWCKARTLVQAYYMKLGFHPYGEVFDYPPIGLHIVMYRRLKLGVEVPH